MLFNGKMEWENIIDSIVVSLGLTRRISSRSAELYMTNKHFLNIFFENNYFESKAVIAMLASVFMNLHHSIRKCRENITFIHIQHRSIRYNTQFFSTVKFFLSNFFANGTNGTLFTHIHMYRRLAIRKHERKRIKKKGRKEDRKDQEANIYRR